MKKILLVLFMLFLLPQTTFAFETSAKSAILMDTESGRILYSKNAHHKQSVASISKIMTAILAIESGKMDDEVIIGKEIDKAYGSAIYIKHGEKLTLRDLVYGLMLRSGNDAALAIAHKVSGSLENFVKLMNEKAIILGMKDTTFENPHGLDEYPYSGNISSSYDMALLSSYASKNKEYLKIVGTKKYTLKTNKNTYTWHNKNKLLKLYKYTTGGKTGFTKKARRTLVTSAKKGKMHLTAVTINDGNDFKDHEDLYEEAFQKYQQYDLLKKGNIEIYNESLYHQYQFKIKQGFSYPMTKEERKSIYLKINVWKEKNIKNNQKIGIVEVKLDDKVLHKEDIFAQKIKSKPKNWWKKLGEIFS